MAKHEKAKLPAREAQFPACKARRAFHTQVGAGATVKHQ
jgi:hypothetical protein